MERADPTKNRPVDADQMKPDKVDRLIPDMETRLISRTDFERGKLPARWRSEVVRRRLNV